MFDSGTVVPPSPPVRANFTWQAFGGTFTYAGTVGLDLRFLGQMLQAESGLFYNWNRQYDPSIARYTQPDPLGLVDGPSRYAYVGNDPLQKVDPSGLARFSADQSAVLDIANMASNTCLCMADALTLLQWADEYGITNSGGIEVHPNRPVWNIPHINIKNHHIRIC